MGKQTVPMETAASWKLRDAPSVQSFKREQRYDKVDPQEWLRRGDAPSFHR